MYYVYVIESLKDGNYYVGQTNNVLERIKLHNVGKVTSTKYRRPFRLVGYKSYESRKGAMWMEYNLKKHGDRKKKFIIELKGLRPIGPTARRGVS